MNANKLSLCVIVIGIVLLLLTGCAAPPPTPTPLPPPTSTPVPTETPIPPTPTPVPPTETPTPVPPTATPSPIPPTPTRTLTPLPTATSTPATETYVIFTDAFDANCRLATVENTDRSFGCANGEYTMLSKSANSGWWQYYGDEYDNSVIEVDARAPSGEKGVSYGIVFRVGKDGRSFYAFNLSTAGRYAVYYYSRTNGWTALIPYTSSDAVKSGAEKNRLKVAVQGEQIAVYVNDQFLDSVTDSTLATGKIGLYVSTADANGKAAFGNLSISKISRPLALPAAKARPPTPTPAPTIPTGMGGLVIVNNFGYEVYLEIAGKRHTIPANSRIYIHLAPGHYPISGTAAGKSLYCTSSCSVDIQEGKYSSWTFG